MKSLITPQVNELPRNVQYLLLWHANIGEAHLLACIIKSSTGAVALLPQNPSIVDRLCRVNRFECLKCVCFPISFLFQLILCALRIENDDKMPRQIEEYRSHHLPGNLGVV
jgi:hypothetical protein